jgi:hypothetical protein
MSAKELKDRLKALRNEHAGKAITKMTAEEMEREIAHHETARKATELKAKRMEALAKAREAKSSTVKKEVKTAKPAKEAVKIVKPRVKKVKEEIPDASSSEDEKPAKKVAKKGEETIQDRIQKKGQRSEE